MQRDAKDFYIVEFLATFTAMLAAPSIFVAGLDLMHTSFSNTAVPFLYLYHKAFSAEAVFVLSMSDVCLDWSVLDTEIFMMLTQAIPRST